MTWNEPNNSGPPISGYQIRYRKTGESAATWRQWPVDGSNVTSRSVKITTMPDTDDSNVQVHLEPGKQYEVQVRALNGEGDSTSFDVDGQRQLVDRRVAARPGASNEKAGLRQHVARRRRCWKWRKTRGRGRASATPSRPRTPTTIRLTYSLEGPNKGSFTITSAGQIRTRSPLNYEERDEYSLTVKVDDRQRKNNSVAAKSVTIDGDGPYGAAVRAQGADGSGDSRLDGKRARHVGRARERGTGHHTLQRSVRH